MLGAIEIGFETSIWCCIFTHIFFWLNSGKNAETYIIKLPSISSIREYDDEPDGTLFSWFGLILFLPHKAIQSNVMDHSWALAMNHICKNKEPCFYAHKKTSKKLSRPPKYSLGKWKTVSFIFVFYLLSRTS